VIKRSWPVETGVAAVVVAAYAWLALTVPSLRTGQGLAVVLTNASEIAIISAGMTLVIATGGIDV